MATQKTPAGNVGRVVQVIGPVVDAWPKLLPAVRCDRHLARGDDVRFTGAAHIWIRALPTANPSRSTRRGRAAEQERKR